MIIVFCFVSVGVGVRILGDLLRGCIFVSYSYFFIVYVK